MMNLHYFTTRLFSTAVAQKIVIIGGVAGGASFAARARRLNEKVTRNRVDTSRVLLNIIYNISKSKCMNYNYMFICNIYILVHVRDFNIMRFKIYFP